MIGFQVPIKPDGYAEKSIQENNSMYFGGWKNERLCLAAFFII